MAYQNVGTPRFFIDNYQYLRAMGLDPLQYYLNDVTFPNTTEPYVDLGSQWKTVFDNPNAFTLSPEISKEFVNTSNYQDYMKWLIPMGNNVSGMDFSGNMKWYCALLNHNLGDVDAELQSIQFRPSFTGEDAESDQTDKVTILNNENGSNFENNGTTIIYTELVPTSSMVYTGIQLKNEATQIPSVDIGAISMGVMYTMPNSPDLDLNMEIEFDGYDKTTTLGGSDLTNIRYTGSPNWTLDGKYITPFGVGDYYDSTFLGGSKRNGRRTWNLKFSYISDKDLFSSNYMPNDYLEIDGNTSNYDSDDLNTDGNTFEYNMFTDDSFVAQVWNKTCGGALSFIFQPDSNNNQPDQFAICVLDQDSLTISQKAFKSYEIALKIREVW